MSHPDFEELIAAHEFEGGNCTCGLPWHECPYSHYSSALVEVTVDARLGDGVPIPLTVLAQAKAEAWDEGVATALNHAIRNDDGITLRLEHLDGRPWVNPYRSEQEAQ